MLNAMHPRRIGLWAAGIIVVLVLLFAAIIGGSYLYLRTSLPPLSGTMTIAGISGEIVPGGSGCPRVPGVENCV